MILSSGSEMIDMTVIVGTGEICGAKMKDSLCQSRELGRGGRCRRHGGRSTGPKSILGRQRAAENIGKSYEELLSIKKARLAMRLDGEHVL